MLNWCLGDSPLTGATRMAVLMVSEQKHSSGGNWGTVVAAAHNTQLSRQIGEQLLRAICLTSQIVEAGKKGNRTALPTDSHQRFSLCRRAAGLCPCLASKAVRWWRLGLARGWKLGMRRSGIAGAGLCVNFPPRDTHCWCQGQGEVSWACFSKHPAWFKCTKGGELCVVLEDLSSNRICDCFNVSLVG